MAFVRRRIELTFILGQGAFGTNGDRTVRVPDVDAGQAANTATANGLRVRCHINVTGDMTLGEAQLQVYGLSRDISNQLASLAQNAVFLKRNRVIISAGDDNDGMGVIFEGQISKSWADYSSMPDVLMHITAVAGFFYLVKPASPVSFTGSVSIETVVGQIALGMGFRVINNGATAQLSTPYFPGTAIDQLRAACAHANVDLVIEEENRLIEIMPRGQPRSVRSIPVVSPSTGMIGYPMADATGVTVRSVFNRNIRLRGLVKLESSILNATGEWLVIGLTHDLETETHGGQWSTNFQAVNPGTPYARPSIS